MSVTTRRNIAVNQPAPGWHGPGCHAHLRNKAGKSRLAHRRTDGAAGQDAPSPRGKRQAEEEDRMGQAPSLAAPPPALLTTFVS